MKRENVYDFALNLIYSAVISNETDFLFDTTFGTNLLDFAETYSGLDFDTMKNHILEYYSNKELDINMLKKDSGRMTLNELAAKYKRSPQNMRLWCLRNHVDFIPVKSKRLMEN